MFRVVEVDRVVWMVEVVRVAFGCMRLLWLLRCLE